MRILPTYTLITQQRHTSFKASNKNFSTYGILNETEMLHLLRSGSISPDAVCNTGETLLHAVVKNDNVALVNYLTINKKQAKAYINRPFNRQTPLDIAKSKQVREILLSRGAKHFNELPQDAIESYARLSISKPMLNDLNSDVTYSNQRKNSFANDTEALEDRIDKTETKRLNKPNYFDAFEEIEDDDELLNIDSKKVIDKTNDTSLMEEQKLSIIKESSPTKDLLLSNEVPVSAGSNVKSALKRIQNNSLNEVTIESPATFKNYSSLLIENTDPQNFQEIIGLEDAKRELLENIIIPLKDKHTNNVLSQNLIDIPNGILLHAEDNSLALIKALAKETGMPILQLLNPQELTPMLKDVENFYRDKNQRTIILIQGFDNFFPEHSNSLDKNNFRIRIKDCAKRGALIVATAKDKNTIDKSFIEPGIFDKILEIKKPTSQEREKYISKYFCKKPLFSGLNDTKSIRDISNLMEGFSYSNINHILEESGRSSLAIDKNNVDMSLLKCEIGNYAKEIGITPIDEWNKTAMYDTPEFSRIPMSEFEPKSLDELGGMQEIKEHLRNLYVRPMKHLDLLKEELGTSAIPDGAIFYGPAGNGKTYTARVLARELGLPFYETKLSDIGTALVHEEGKVIKKLAKQLDDKYRATGEMSVWFLDEFDSLGGERTGAAQHNKELVDALLQEFNNPSGRGFILIAATNDIKNVDSALKRRGRLGNWISFENPNLEERKDIIRKELAKSKSTKELINDDELINYFAKEFDGSSISNIVLSLNDAKRNSLINGIEFKDAVKNSLYINTKAQMAEFCDKAGLKQHEYHSWDFKTLDELGGMQSVKESLQENIIDVWNPEIRQALINNKRSLPGGVILEGPPGTGKTTIIETLARQMDVPLFKMNYSQSGNEFIHGVARNVTDIFNRLALQAKIIKRPVMLFFDEAEKFFPRYADKHQIEEVNTYKELMNNASANNIILVGATNHIDLVNAEIIGNPRRMGVVIHCGNPATEDRGKLLNKLLSNLPILTGEISDEEMKALVNITDGLSTGDIASIIDKTITKAVKTKQNLTGETLMKSFKQLLTCC